MALAVNFLKNRKKKRGFSFIEVLVSIFVLSVSLVAVITLIAASILHSADSRDVVIASHLAQEGTELVRNIRDNNWANARPFDSGIADGEACVDSTFNTSDGSSLPSCFDYRLYYDEANKRYVHDSWFPASKFSRRLFIYTNSNGKNVVSVVIWGRVFPPALDECSVSRKCLYLESVLTDWRQVL